MAGKKTTASKLGKFGKIYKSVWDDEDFRDLSMGAQNLYWMLSNSQQTSFAGVLLLAPGRFTGLAKDLTEAKFNKYLRELEAKNFVIVDKKTLEVIIRTFIKWDESLRNPNLSVAVGRAIENIFSKKLRAKLAEELARNMLEYPDLVGWEVLADTIPAFFEHVIQAYQNPNSPGNSTKKAEAPSEPLTRTLPEPPTEEPWEAPDLPVRYPMPN